MAHRHHRHEDDSDLRPAFFSERLSAFLIDGLLFYAAFLLMLGLVYPDTPVLLNYKGRPWLLVWAALFMIYHAEAAAAGRATFGKWLLGLKVVAQDGGSLSIQQAFVRSMGYLLSSILNLGFLWALFDRDGRAWHDLLAGSKVVAVRPRPYPFAFAGGIASMAFLVGTFMWQAFGAPHFYRVQTVAHAQLALKSLSTLEQVHRSRSGEFTENVDHLVNLTVDPDAYYQALATAFAPEKGIRIVVDPDGKGYTLTAYARDRMRTQIKVEGGAGS